MLGLLALLNIASFAAFVVGLFNPKLVLRGDSRTRLKSSGIYLSIFLASGLTAGALAPQKREPVTTVAPVEAPKIAIAPQPTQEVKPLPTQTPPVPTPKQETKPTPAPEFIAFDPSVCKSDRYLRANGASIALYTTCQYLNTGTFKPDVVVAVTGAGGSNDPAVLELQAEAGFAGITWQDYYSEKQDRDVCVEYKDQSVSCYKFTTEPDETPTTQPQSQLPACTKTDCDCGDFATPDQAQRVLDAYPGDPFKLDRDKDGVACDAG